MTSTTVKVSPFTNLSLFEIFTPGQTKAKKRYLRAKKERKRHRRVAAARSAPAGGIARRDDGGEDEDDEGEEGRASEPDAESDIILDVDGKGAQSEHEKTAGQRQARKEKHRKKGKSDTGTITPADEGDASRPRKRRKLDRSDPRPGPSRSPAAAVDSSPSATSSPVSGSPEPPHDPPTLDHRARTHTPLPSSLPRFPLPSRPRAPEKSELVSQGLDRSLACAQLVDPLLSTPLSLDEGGGDVAGLSTRMIRRLRDLGIMELFAGAYRLASQETQY